jgi:predicted Holliday junction resolvase-like endonuclease
LPDNSNDALSIFNTLKLTLLIVFPLGVLMALIFHFKTKADQEVKAGLIDNQLLKEQMAQIAKQKLAEREQEIKDAETVKLPPEEIRKKLESEREVYPDFNPVIPLHDLDDDESVSEEK